MATKWDTLTSIGGTSIARGDLALVSDQSQADGSQDRTATMAALSLAIPKYEVTESSHGLSVGEAVRFDGTNYVEATADTAANAEMLGLIVEVPDTDTIVFQQVGYATGLSGLTAGDFYYLQDAGTTAGTVSTPVLVADTTTSGWLVPLGQGGGGGGPTTESFILACSDETTALTTGTGVMTFRMPYAFTLSDVRASVGTAPTGAAIQVDINEGGVSILSTVLSIDATEKTSETAATAAVISDSALADDAEITIDVDQVGSTVAGAGLKVTLIGTQA